MSAEYEAVRRLGEAIGFGRMMQLAEEIWGQRDKRGGQLTVGPAAVFLVPCSHPVLDANEHCVVCCGSGRVTKWVAENACKL